MEPTDDVIADIVDAAEEIRSAGRGSKRFGADATAFGERWSAGGGDTAFLPNPPGYLNPLLSNRASATLLSSKETPRMRPMVRLRLRNPRYERDFPNRLNSHRTGDGISI